MKLKAKQNFGGEIRIKQYLAPNRNARMRWRTKWRIFPVLQNGVALAWTKMKLK